MTDLSNDKSGREPSMDPETWNHYVRMIVFVLESKACQKQYRVMRSVLHQCALKLLELIKDPESGVDLAALDGEMQP